VFQSFVCAQTNDWNTLNEKNYSIEYPSDWELNKSGQMGTKFILFSQLTSKNDQFKENVNLIVQDLTGHNIDLNQYVEISENQIKTMITDGNIISSERVKKDEKEFQRVIYTGKQGIYDLQFVQYYWVENNNAYVLTLTCEITVFTDFKNTGEKILNSFEIRKN
tara:strand:+ start:504 stop:995 length:492 start_codon:yes stop_codon:yes gene_type:complete